MNMYYKILLKPILTEKWLFFKKEVISTHLLFQKSCNKNIIKQAVEQKFDVRVTKVSTINQLGKQKQLTVKSGGRTIRTSGYRPSFKKAIVTLHKDDNIDFIGGEG